ncbi:DUF91 domain-containing protein [Candidatus Parcubacteria bacterium]|nr:DUF91 domain-containing protein [Candidatus Parcubacteria bacterium]
MTTHVFIVDSTTFKIHLEYLFAGTGAKDNSIDFNNNVNTKLYATTENMLVNMIADASRIRKDDQIIFYLQQKFADKIFEGKFYGIFKAKKDLSFLDDNDGSQYLSQELGKSLTFRTLIKPYKIYPEGVTEWEALDEIKNIQSPNQMLWSLIYRKLKGHRGNTMITIYESERLCQLIRNKNNRKYLECENKLLTFDSASQVIKCVNKDTKEYQGNEDEVNILPRLITKLDQNKAFEAHLQAYIVRNIGRGINQKLDSPVLGESNIEWLGNEVSCGVGMQRIDIMLSVFQDSQRVLLPVELKAVEADEKNTIQIQRYIDWIEQYYIPNRQSDIQPILISKKVVSKKSERYQKTLSSFKQFNKNNIKRCNSLIYIEFEVNNNDLSFNKINY